jgi:hypothetical protein
MAIKGHQTDARLNRKLHHVVQGRDENGPSVRAFNFFGKNRLGW